MTIPLEEFAPRLRALAAAPYAPALAGAIVTEGVKVMRDTMGVDTGQLRARTNVTSVEGTASSARAEWRADTPYAGFHNIYNGFADDGMMMMEQAANRAAPGMATELERVLVSGGVPNPRRLVRELGFNPWADSPQVA